MTALRQRMLEDLQIRNYLEPNTSGPINCFLVKEGRLSQSTYIQVVSALRFLYTQTLNRQVSIERIPFPRRERKLPIIMSREEVKALLEAPRNLRHRALLTTMYVAGPRVSEVARLKAGDIDSARHVLWIRGGKGRKDRQTRLRLRLLELLRSYWRLETPRQWLFPGSQPDQPISVKSIFLACRSAARKAHITKPFTRSEVASLSDLQTRPDASVARHLMMIGTCRRCPRRTHLRSSERRGIPVRTSCISIPWPPVSPSAPHHPSFLCNIGVPQASSALYSAPVRRSSLTHLAWRSVYSSTSKSQVWTGSVSFIRPCLFATRLLPTGGGRCPVNSWMRRCRRWRLAESSCADSSSRNGSLSRVSRSSIGVAPC